MKKLSVILLPGNKTDTGLVFPQTPGVGASLDFAGVSVNYKNAAGWQHFEDTEI